jgi:hypothetical protein
METDYRIQEFPDVPNSLRKKLFVSLCNLSQDPRLIFRGISEISKVSLYLPDLKFARFARFGNKDMRAG